MESGGDRLAHDEYGGDSFGETIRVVWSKNSKRLGVNCRAGGRYYSTSLFKIDGLRFIELPSREEALVDPLQATGAGLKSAAYLADGHRQGRLFPATCEFVCHAA